MVDWLVAWGTAQTVGKLVAPILQDIMKDGAKDLAIGFFKDTVTHRFSNKDPRQVATGKAIKVLLQRIQKELKHRHKIPDSEIQHCVADIKNFLLKKTSKNFSENHLILAAIL
ncbi:MAG: hypothetical protein HC908_12315 [Calothrix sp. SM1_7_51]|nr:hypothetical protein [Calothrix sp. SM1_7_51]